MGFECEVTACKCNSRTTCTYLGKVQCAHALSRPSRARSRICHVPYALYFALYVLSTGTHPFSTSSIDASLKQPMMAFNSPGSFMTVIFDVKILELGVLQYMQVLQPFKHLSSLHSPKKNLENTKIDAVNVVDVVLLTTDATKAAPF